MTCAHTISRLSAITGLTLPGMMLEPGWTAGSFSSPMPQRGPEPSQRISLAIFVSATAMPRSAPLRSNSRVPRRLGFEVVFRFHERKAGRARDVGNGFGGESRGRVQSRADGGSAQRQFDTDPEWRT